jgi:hypothetical protein
MFDRNTARGLFLILLSLIFGLQSLRYSMGKIESAGPGMFPLVISLLLFAIGLATVVNARFIEKDPMTFNFKNIGIILGSLIVFGVLSTYLNMIIGITVMVFCASFAATKYSIVRNIQIAAALIAIALVFQKLLGLELPLY